MSVMHGVRGAGGVYEMWYVVGSGRDRRVLLFATTRSVVKSVKVPVVELAKCTN